MSLKDVRLLRRLRAAASTIAGVLLYAGAGAAQSPPPAAATATQTSARSLQARQVEQAPVLDGDILGDPAWTSAGVAADFRQTTPDDGAPASERTEVRIVYTRTALYVGVICYDRSPAGIIVSDARRDASLDETDSFRLILDTYRDGQNGFVFGTNPAGLEYDGQVINQGEGGGGGNFQQSGSGGGFNLNWDGSWQVRTQVNGAGWTAEFEIPFRTLRYPGLDVHTWGINFQRNIRRRNEVAYWTPLPRQYDLFRLSQAGTLTALAAPPLRNLKLIPYALGQLRNETRRPEDPTLLGDVGVDLKYSLTPSLTLDATYNTDFAQVEVDEQQINLDRFNLFFPEKRPFFLENAGLFAVGAPSEAEVFFSRRIGIADDGREIPIIGGARVSGRVAQSLDVGFLNMQTEDITGLAPGNNFTAARLRRELRNRSSVGGIFVNRTRTSHGPATDYNRVAALDGRLGIGENGMVSGWFARSSSPGRSSDQDAYQVSAQHETPSWLLSASFLDVGQFFNPEVGFLGRSGGFRKPDLLVFHTWRPQSLLKLQEVRPHVSYRGYWKPDGYHESGQLHIDSHWEWKSGHEIHTGINVNHEGVRAPFTIAGVPVLPGEYDHREAQIVAFTNEGAWWGVRLRATIGGFYGGDRVAVTPAFRFRLGDAFNTELTWSRNDIELPAGRVVTNLVRSRIAYSFTPRLFAQGLLQYNDDADVWSTNLRFGWLNEANTGLFIVYNNTQLLDDDVIGSTSVVPGHSLIVKVSRIFDMLR
jgi:hypothetical protein